MIAGLGDISSQYDAAFVDVWGVLHNGLRPHPGAPEACQRFRAECGPLILVSNSPRPSDGVIAQLRSLGIPDDTYDGVVTSGDATRAELAKRAPGPVFAISPEKDAHLYDGLALEFSSLEDARFVSITGLFDDCTQTPADYAEMLTQMQSKRLEMVCANPDIVVEVGDQIIYCAGAVAQAYDAIGGQVVMSGKPHAPIYELALEKLASVTGKPATTDRLLAIGDGPLTDLRGANQLGADCFFIVSGMHGEALQGQAVTAAIAGRIARDADAHATYAAPTLVW